jgi:hypothetical protein
VIAPWETHARSLRPLAWENESEHCRQARPRREDLHRYRAVSRYTRGSPVIVSISATDH